MWNGRGRSREGLRYSKGHQVIGCLRKGRQKVCSAGFVVNAGNLGSANRQDLGIPSVATPVARGDEVCATREGDHGRSGTNESIARPIKQGPVTVALAWRYPVPADVGLEDGMGRTSGEARSVDDDGSDAESTGDERKGESGTWAPTPTRPYPIWLKIEPPKRRLSPTPAQLSRPTWARLSRQIGAFLRSRLNNSAIASQPGARRARRDAALGRDHRRRGGGPSLGGVRASGVGHARSHERRDATTRVGRADRSDARVARRRGGRGLGGAQGRVGRSPHGEHDARPIRCG